MQAIAKRLNVVTTSLQTGILQTRMQPVDLIFSKYNRVVRDLSKQLNKQIQVSIESNDVELDKNIIESLQDPLTHLIRNAIDHGIESPEIREKNGKKPEGKIVIAAYHKAGYVNIRIIDDGKGMDPNELINTAIKKGVITQKQADTYTAQDAFNLIFKPGFSTATEVSEISGRGVGMDVVKSNLQKIGGVININSQKGSGTTIDINLPLTLSIMQALIVLVEDVCFAIPEFNISEVVKLYGEEIYSKINMVNDQELFSLRGKLIPIIRLSKILKMEKTYIDPKTGEKKIDRRSDRASQDQKKTARRSALENHIYILILTLGNIQFGLVVDDIIDTEEIVIKALHEQLKKIKVFIGTTILGDGRIATIVDIGNLAELETFNISKIEALKEEKKTITDDKQVVLTFNLNGNETFAVPLFLISHIEKISERQILIANQKKYFKYQGEVIQLINIENVMEDIEAHYLDEMFVLIIKGIKPIGIIVAQIIDTVLISSNIDTKTIIRPGIIGGTLMNNNLILILDIFTIIDRVEPAWIFHSLDLNQDKKKKILLLEDMKFYKSILVSYLAGTGMEVMVVDNGQEGIECLKNNDFDLIISDLQMPVMDGFQFAKYVKSKPQYDHIKLVAISSMYEKEKGLELVKEAGFETYINKLNREELLHCLEDLIK